MDDNAVMGEVLIKIDSHGDIQVAMKGKVQPGHLMTAAGLITKFAFEMIDAAKMQQAEIAEMGSILRAHR